MKHLANTYRIRIALFTTFLLLSGLNLHAQYKLELEWETQPGGKSYGITSLLNYDSLVIVTGQNNFTKEYIAYFVDSLGIVKKEIKTNYLLGKLSKTKTEGQIFAVTGGLFLGILDLNSLEFIYRIDESNNQKSISGSYNKVQDKILTYGTLDNQFIKIYDVTTKQLLKEFGAGYFPNKEKYIQNANLSDDGKYIVYSTWNRTQEGSNWVTRYYLKMIDLQGNLVKDFGEVGSPIFGFTYDGKQLIYATNNNINFFDLEKSNLVESINIPTGDIGVLEISSDGKFLLIGGAVISYVDLEKKNSYSTGLSAGSVMRFDLNLTNSSLFWGGERKLYKFNLKPTTYADYIQNKLEFTINITNNKLILTNPQNLQINTLTAYDILGRTYPLSANGNEVDVSGLTAGRYFLKVGLADGSFLDFGFLVY